MSIGALLVGAVSGIAPVFPKVYTGPEDHYFVYDITDDRGDDWGDDIPDKIHYWIRLNYYYPMGENQTSMRNRVRNLLHEAGFSFASIISLSDPDNGMDGLSWECDIVVAESEESNG